VLGRTDSLIAPHPVYTAPGRYDTERRAAYQALFRTESDAAAIHDLRLALNQNQPVGNPRFLAWVARAMEERPQGRRRSQAAAVSASGEQVESNRWVNGAPQNFWRRFRRDRRTQASGKLSVLPVSTHHETLPPCLLPKPPNCVNVR
jgi:hypothetical protein